MRWTGVVMAACVACGGATDPAETQAPAVSSPSEAPAEPSAAEAPAEPSAAASPAEPGAATAPAEPSAAPPSQGGIVEGPVFHAIGQEPGWMLDVSTAKGMDSLAYVGDYGSVKLNFPAAARVEDQNHMSWSASIDGHTLSVAAERKPCQDAMSGKDFEATVKLVIDGKTLTGCGNAAR